MDKNFTKAEKAGAAAGAVSGLVAGGPGGAVAGAGVGYAAGKAWDSRRGEGTTDDAGSDE